MKWLAKRKCPLLKGRKGFTLMETMIALGLLGIIGGAFLTGLATGTKSTATLDEGAKAQALAQAQLEDIKVADYSLTNSYPKTVTEPAGYLLTITVVEKVVGQKQEITVTVTHGGDFVLKMSTMKTNPLPPP